MTQHQLVIDYLEEYGSIVPAKLAGFVYKGVMMGSETTKRCRELRAHKLHNVLKYPILESVREGKFEKFYLKPKAIHLQPTPNLSISIPKDFLKLKQEPLIK